VKVKFILDHKKQIITLVIIILLLNLQPNSHLENRSVLFLNDDTDNSWTRILMQEQELLHPDMYLMNDTIIILGDYGDNVHTYETYVAKYNTNGSNLWDFRVEDELDVKYQKSVVDSENNIYVSTLVGNNFGGKIMLLKLDQYGEQLYVKFINESLECTIDSMTKDLNDSIYITGHDLQNDKGYLLKVDVDGNLLNSIFLNDTAFYHELLIDDYNNLYVSGSLPDVYEDPWCSGAPLYKFNSTCSLLWKLELQNSKDSFRFLNIDEQENALVAYYQFSSIYSRYNLYILKLNSTGEINREIKILSNYKERGINWNCWVWYINNTYLFYNTFDETYLVNIDNDCNLKWNLSIQQYLKTEYFAPERFGPPIESVYDSNGSIYLIYRYRSSETRGDYQRDIGILQLNKLGVVNSRYYWGGSYIDDVSTVIIDSQDNLFLIVVYEYINIWNAYWYVSIFIKNPYSGWYPPSLEEFDIGLIFVYSFLGASSALSIVIAINIIRRNIDKNLNKSRNESNQSN